MTRLEAIAARCKTYRYWGGWTITGKTVATEDVPWLLERLDEAAEVLREVPPCNCHPGFSERKLTDPQCHRCVCSPGGEIDAALAKLDEPERGTGCQAST